MQCTKVEGGEWLPVEGSPGPRPSSGFGAFVFIALLVSLIPAFVGVSIAGRAGVSTSVGFAIGLFGSWIGVIVLYVGSLAQERQPPSVPSAGPSTGPPTDEGMGPAVGATLPGRAPEPADGARAGRATAPSGAAERLRTLKDLLDQDLITQEEHDARRARVIESL